MQIQISAPFWSMWSACEQFVNSLCRICIQVEHTVKTRLKISSSSPLQEHVWSQHDVLLQSEAQTGLTSRLAIHSHDAHLQTELFKLWKKTFSSSTSMQKKATGHFGDVALQPRTQINRTDRQIGYTLTGCMPTWETFQALQNQLFIARTSNGVLDDDMVWWTFWVTTRQEVRPWSVER